VSRFLLLSIVLAGCAGFEHVSRSTLPTAEQYPGADAVVLDDDVEVRYARDPLTGRLVIDETAHVRALILREGGEALATVRVEYNPTFSSLASFSARTVTEGGNERRFSASDGVDAPAFSGYALYSDDRALEVPLSPRTPGTVIEYRYRRHYHDWRLATFAQRFEGRYPERRARLTVIAPIAWQIESAAGRQDQSIRFAPTVSQAHGVATSVWERHDMPALPSDPFAPPRDQTAMVVAVRLARWTERDREVRAPADLRALSAWLFTLTRPKPTSSATAAFARELVRSLPDDRAEQARRLYTWVRDQVSYCAIEIGYGGWQPHAADDVFRHRYGDCKDKANLLREMFAAVGGTSDLVALYAHDGMPEALDLLTQRINHAILLMHLPTGDVLADPTSQTAAFGTLPLSDQEADYLPLTAEGVELGHAPPSSAEDNRVDVELALTPKDGELVGSVQASVRGAHADRLRARLLRTRREDQGKPVIETLALGHLRLTAWHVDGAAPPETPTPVGVKGLVRIPHGWPSARVHLVSAASVLGSQLPALPAGPRAAPLVFPCRERRAERGRLTLGDVSEIALPAPTIIERPFGRYELRWTVADGKLVVERTFVLAKRIFSPTAYAAVKEFFDEVLAADTHGVLIGRQPQ
jgi:transglutaminase-like putative cysteine protease